MTFEEFRDQITEKYNALADALHSTPGTDVPLGVHAAMHALADVISAARQVPTKGE